MFCVIEDYGNCTKYLNKALEIYLYNFGETYQMVALIYHNFGNIHSLKKEEEKAVEFFEKAKSIYVDEDPNMASLYHNLANTYETLGRVDEAISHLNKAKEIASNFYGPNTSYLTTMEAQLGVLYHKKQNYKMALASYEEALRIHKLFYAEEDPNLGYLYESIGGAHLELESFDDAREFYQKALKIYQDFYNKPDPRIGNAFYKLGVACQGQREYDEALNFLKQAAEHYPGDKESLDLIDKKLIEIKKLKRGAGDAIEL